MRKHILPLMPSVFMIVSMLPIHVDTEHSTTATAQFSHDTVNISEPSSDESSTSWMVTASLQLADYVMMKALA